MHCHKCKGNFTTYEPFWDLSVPIAKEGKSGISAWLSGKTVPTTIQDCLQTFSADEILQVCAASDVQSTLSVVVSCDASAMHLCLCNRCLPHGTGSTNVLGLHISSCAYSISDATVSVRLRMLDGWCKLLPYCVKARYVDRLLYHICMSGMVLKHDLNIVRPQVPPLSIEQRSIKPKHSCSPGTLC